MNSDEFFEEITKSCEKRIHKKYKSEITALMRENARLEKLIPKISVELVERERVVKEREAALKKAESNMRGAVQHLVSWEKKLKEFANKPIKSVVQRPGWEPGWETTSRDRLEMVKRYAPPKRKTTKKAVRKKARRIRRR